MFWGLILKTNKKYSQTVQKAFHLSQAALDLTKSAGGDVQVMLTSEENTYLLCTLGKDRPQCQLDLNFEEGDQISLATKGDGMVHLTGYLVPSEEDMFGGLGDEEEEEDEELEVEDEDDVPAAKNAKAAKQDRIAKKVAQKVNAKEVQMEEGEEDDMDETFELPKGAKKQQKGGNGAAADSDEDSDEDDSDEDDSDDEGLDDSKADGEDQDEDDSDEDDDDDDDDDDEEDDSEDEQPKAKVAKVEKKPAKQNGVENGKASPKELKKEEKSSQGQKDEAKTRTLQGGLIVEDMKVGSGAEAKPGKKIAVFYEGRLKKNNKVFDSATKGPGFKFALGRGEVIKGWDVGVAGMKVGGKRRLTVPHQMAYGTRGSPPVIPPNSTLVFDVELKNVF